MSAAVSPPAASRRPSATRVLAALTRAATAKEGSGAVCSLSLHHPRVAGVGAHSRDPIGVHWVIVGGESGPGARQMHPAWARQLVRQCQQAGVAVFVKQLGSHFGRDHHNLNAFPPDLQVREWPDQAVQP